MALLKDKQLLVKKHLSMQQLRFMPCGCLVIYQPNTYAMAECIGTQFLVLYKLAIAEWQTTAIEEICVLRVTNIDRPLLHVFWCNHCSQLYHRVGSYTRSGCPHFHHTETVHYWKAVGELLNQTDPLSLGLHLCKGTARLIFGISISLPPHIILYYWAVVYAALCCVFESCYLSCFSSVYFARYCGFEWKNNRVALRDLEF